MSPSNLRRDYRLASLDPSDVSADPLAQFRSWFDDAQSAGLPEPNAMTLATATRDGRPSARVVLLKTIDDRGLGFFTDYRSRKAQELDANPRAALSFSWLELERQVRIEGTVSRMAPDESAGYFQSRPLGSRYGAWASVQSAVIPDRAWLEGKVKGSRHATPMARYHCLPIGAGSVSHRSCTSSGRGVRAGCTTACGTGRTGTPGWLSGWRRECS